MMQSKKIVSTPILIADDDADDRMLIKDAFQEYSSCTELIFVEDGQQVIDYLNDKSNPHYALPKIIVLDLNMPKKDGIEVLKELKAHEIFRKIPIIILTTSKNEEHIAQTYALGANCFIIKPATYNELVEIAKTCCKFWFEVAQLPA